MIRVLFVDHGEALGGAEYCLVSLLEHLDRARFWPILACSEGPLADAGRRIEVLVRTLEMPRLRGELAALPRLWRGLRRLRAIIAADGADLVYSNTMRASFYAALAARWCRRPLLWHVHDIYPRGVYVRWMSRLVQAAIAVSAAAAAALPGRLPVDVAPNGVDLPRFDAQVTDGSAARREWGVPDSAPLVGMAGRLWPWKGQVDFLRAMALVCVRAPAARCALIGGTVFAGAEDYPGELRRLVDELGLTGSVVFVGHREDLPAVLPALDVLVHCSIEPEPFGRVMIEGMAAGLPVVAYDHGGASEIVVAGETGLLVPVRDTGALGEAVLSLLGDKALARRLGSAGRRRVESQYRASDVAARIAEVIERVARPV